jgi:uncharacterized protein YecT (DUF1311 family)
MPTDQSADPWSGSSYNGFSSGPSRPTPAAAPVPRRPSTRNLLIGGIAAAAVLGIGLGFLATPHHLNTGDGPVRAPMHAVTPPADAAGQVQIAVNPPPPLPKSGRLNVLPGQPPQAAPSAAAQPAQVTTPPQPLVIQPESMRAPAPTPASVPAAGPPIPDVMATPRLRASFDCATAQPGAEQMVCSDPALAAADRELAHAYRRAMNAGVDPRDLRGEQRDWLMIRDDAAHHSPRALADVYDQRIDELNRMADDAGQ